MTKVVLLTLKKHKEGIWVTKLAQALHKAGQENIQIKSIEEFFNAALLVNTLFDGIDAIINRCSDAADPIAFKTAVTLLTAASKRGIPVFNGPEAYMLCASKYCHHLVFEMAAVKTPPSSIFNSSQSADVEACVRHATTSDGAALRYPLLIKPNAGGFGSGIHRLESEKESEAITKDQLHTPDEIRLLQNYMKPSDGHIYRVWFLDKQVQCAVKRRVHDTSDDLRTGCAGTGVCQRPPQNNNDNESMPFTAFHVPSAIRQDVKRILTQISDAHAGSIEFLYDSNQRPIYFDLNLLSTLPISGTVDLADEIWGQGYDPWFELAQNIMLICKPRR